MDAQQQPQSSDPFARFFEALRDASRRVLLLDFDGTLAPFHVERAQARPYEGVAGLLEAIRANGTRLVIVSGRPARDVAELVPLPGGVEIWGTHGWERLLPSGSYTLHALPATAKAGLARAERRLREGGLGTHLEPKAAALAVHWRGEEPAHAARIEATAKAAFEEAARDGVLQLLPFDAGIELRATCRNKGDVARDIMGEEPDAAIAYLGDDITDEDAFAAVKPRGLAVLVRDRDRPTRAHARIEPPAGLLRFLTRWRDATGAA